MGVLELGVSVEDHGCGRFIANRHGTGHIHRDGFPVGVVIVISPFTPSVAIVSGCGIVTVFVALSRCVAIAPKSERLLADVTHLQLAIGPLFGPDTTVRIDQVYPRPADPNRRAVEDCLLLVEARIFVPPRRLAVEQRLDDVVVLRGVSARLRKDFDRANVLMRLDISLDPHDHLTAHADHLQSSQVD